VDDRTGSLLPGGESVLFSPDRQYYLAWEQPDGQDGETLKLCRRDGKILWKGYGGILSDDGTMVVVGSENMGNMRWDSRNRPQATAHLRGGRTQTVTLTETRDGKREWRPRIE
jgi:hypothetical protein